MQRVLMSIVAVSTCFLVEWASSLEAQPPQPADVPAEVKQYRDLNCLVVTPNGPEDGGDFGPKTPGTKTSGLQEAFNLAHEQTKDLLVAGGGFDDTTRKSIAYHLSETLHIPWMHNFRLYGGEYFLIYTAEQGDAVVIDSQMNCRLKFGLVACAKSDGAVVRIAPTSKGPDGFSCIVANTFELGGLVGAGDVWGKSSDQKSTGLILDATKGSIGGNRIFINEINGCRQGIYVMQGCSNNTIEVQWIHLTNLAIQLGSAEAPNISGNRIIAGISGDVPKTTGVQLFGHHNTLMLDVFSADPGRALVLEQPAHDNLIISSNLAGGITNLAAKPTNRLVTAGAMGHHVETPPMPASGAEVANRNLRPVEVRILTPGKVSQWAEIDVEGRVHSFKAPLTAGQAFTLNPGDKVRFTYEVAPTWFWKRK